MNLSKHLNEWFSFGSGSISPNDKTIEVRKKELNKRTSFVSAFSISMLKERDSEIKDIQELINSLYKKTYFDKAIATPFYSQCSLVKNVYFAENDHHKELTVVMTKYDTEQHRKICSMYLDILDEYPLGYFDLNIEY